MPRRKKTETPDAVAAGPAQPANGRSRKAPLHGSGVYTPIQYVKGIGPKRAAALESLGMETVRDLLYYFPRRYLDLSRVEAISSLGMYIDTDQWVNVVGSVRKFDMVGRPPKQRFVLILEDGTGSIPLTFFQNACYFKNAFEIGQTLAVTGRVSQFRNRPQMIHPVIDRLTAKDEDGEPENESRQPLPQKGLVAQYSSTEELRRVRLDSRGMRKIMQSAINQHLNGIKEFLPPEILKAENLLPLQDAIRLVHFPENQSEADTARRRLKFDELFLLQLLLAIRRKNIKADMPGISFTVESKLARQMVDSLPFELTKSQVKVIREIAADMKAPTPMNRLLQGDVGSGKTVVSVTGMLIAIENGFQVAFMAPTEILAEQHYQTITSLVRGLPVNVRLLVSGLKKRVRDDILEDIREGSANIVVGTHALIQEGVDFARLGFVVIDEQHRFGVMQRAILRERGAVLNRRRCLPDVLVMTATPIPRTLALTIYGDLDVSTIGELPERRIPIRTAVRTESQRSQVYEFIRSEVRQGRQAYVVYPLIEESEKLDLKAASESYELLRTEVFPDLRVGLLHGRMTSEEKDAIMGLFKERELDVLVSTTVVEVGIDIPNASVMLVEHAERFGLAQLHQLRGRVGRGADQSYCILIAPDWMGPRLKRSPAKKSGSITDEAMASEEAENQVRAERRLKTMLITLDGFKIAEIDLELRGPGDFFGTRQSGLPELQIANLVTDSAILNRARDQAFALIHTDPELRSPAVQPLRHHFDEQMAEALALADVS